MLTSRGTRSADSIYPLVLPAIWAWSFAMIGLAVLRGTRHDYLAYLNQWALVIHGDNPWSGDNTYGPLHSALAYFTHFGALGPKLVMLAIFLAVNLLMVRSLMRTRPTIATLAAYAAIVPLNFVVVSVAASFGLNDTLAAALVGGAVLARFSGRSTFAGVFLGLGILLKWYPALMVPFFCLDEGRFDWKTLLSSAATTAAGLLVAFGIWGPALVTSLSAGVGFQPKLLSILASLQLHPELGGESFAINALIRANAGLVILACASIFVLARKSRISWIEGAALASLAYLTVYKVGHPQYYLPWLMLLVGLLIAGTSRATRHAYACVPMALFLSAFQFGYEVLTDGYELIAPAVRTNIGFFAFAIEAVTLVLILRMIWPQKAGSALVPSIDAPAE